MVSVSFRKWVTWNISFQELLEGLNRNSKRLSFRSSERIILGRTEIPELQIRDILSTIASIIRSSFRIETYGPNRSVRNQQKRFSDRGERKAHSKTANHGQQTNLEHSFEMSFTFLPRSGILEPLSLVRDLLFWPVDAILEIYPDKRMILFEQFVRWSLIWKLLLVTFGNFKS